VFTLAPIEFHGCLTIASENAAYFFLSLLPSETQGNQGLPQISVGMSPLLEKHWQVQIIKLEEVLDCGAWLAQCCSYQLLALPLRQEPLYLARLIRLCSGNFKL